MRLLAVVAGLTLAAIGQGASAASVEVKNAAARVSVIPEARSDIKVEMVTTNPKLALEVRSQGDRVIVDGKLRFRAISCHSEGGRMRVSVLGVGDVALADLPQVVIRTPMDVNVAAGGAVFGVVGKSASLQLSNAGCGDWTAANVNGHMAVHIAGSGDLATGSAGDAKIRIAGSGDVRTQAIASGLEANIAGSGDISAASASGPVDVRIAGSGDVTIAGGHASKLTASIAGSGDIAFDGVADSLSAKVAGSGDVKVKQVTGVVSKSVVGSGSVTVG